MTIIEELLTVRDEMNIKTDEMNRRIELFEEDLKKLGIGLTCWVKLDDKVRIGHAKIGDKWRIVSELTLEDGTKSVTALVHTSRNVRLAGYNLREEVLKELLETAKKFTKKLDEALK